MMQTYQIVTVPRTQLAPSQQQPQPQPAPQQTVQQPTLTISSLLTPPDDMSCKSNMKCEMDQLKSIVNLLLQFKYILIYINKNLPLNLELRLKEVLPELADDIHSCLDQYRQIIHSSSSFSLFEFIRKKEAFYHSFDDSYFCFKQQSFVSPRMGSLDGVDDGVDEANIDDAINTLFHQSQPQHVQIQQQQQQPQNQIHLQQNIQQNSQQQVLQQQTSNQNQQNLAQNQLQQQQQQQQQNLQQTLQQQNLQQNSTIQILTTQNGPSQQNGQIMVNQQQQQQNGNTYFETVPDHSLFQIASNSNAYGGAQFVLTNNQFCFETSQTLETVPGTIQNHQQMLTHSQQQPILQQQQQQTTIQQQQQQTNHQQQQPQQHPQQQQQQPQQQTLHLDDPLDDLDDSMESIENDPFGESSQDHNQNGVQFSIEPDLLQMEYWCTFDSCRFKSKSLPQVKAHEERRHVKQIVQCSEDGCQTVFSTKDDMTHHLEDIHSGPLFRCVLNECEKEFQSDYRLKQHVRDEHKDEYLTCKICKKKFKSRKYLTRHFRNLHPLDKVGEENASIVSSADIVCAGTSGKLFSIMCTINGCDRKFGKRSKLKQHIKEQHQEEYLTCKFCDKVCKTRNNLTNHIWIMHEEGDYRCTFDDCDFSSTFRKNLLNHKKLRHQRIRKCPINECGEEVPITRYQRHMSSLHKIKNYACSWPECGKSFADHNALKNHVRIHLNFKRYKCKWPQCGYASEQRFTVITHIRVCHFKLPRTKKKQIELNISEDSVQNPYDYLEVCREDICV